MRLVLVLVGKKRYEKSRHVKDWRSMEHYGTVSRPLVFGRTLHFKEFIITVSSVFRSELLITIFVKFELGFKGNTFQICSGLRPLTKPCLLLAVLYVLGIIMVYLAWELIKEGLLIAHFDSPLLLFKSTIRSIQSASGEIQLKGSNLVALHPSGAIH